MQPWWSWKCKKAQRIVRYCQGRGQPSLLSTSLQGEKIWKNLACLLRSSRGGFSWAKNEGQKAVTPVRSSLPWVWMNVVAEKAEMSRGELKDSSRVSSLVFDRDDASDGLYSRQILVEDS